MSDTTVRIAMWSGPRNISTAMMRAFENRGDTFVWDEPLYASYLWETGIEHPMAAQIVATYENDWRRVVDRLCDAAPDGSRVFYQKHMTHHILPDYDLSWLRCLSNCFLIRDPVRVAASYREKRADVNLEDLGYAQQLRLFEEASSLIGRPAPVFDCDDILADPRGRLTDLCRAVGIEFEPAMLEWPAGRRESDGIWASHWYGAVEASTGFRPPYDEATEIPDTLRGIVEAAVPIYESMRRHRLHGESGA
jgi:hypothetical protein